MRLFRFRRACGAGLCHRFICGAFAQTKITVGKITSGSGFHTPSYVAMDKGFFKEEGLDASFVTLARARAGDRGTFGQPRF